MSAPIYMPFDQNKHLGPPPWRKGDPAVQAWEQAHNHDVRLKCYVEFGCQAIATEHERYQEALTTIAAMRQEADDWGHPDFDWRMIARKQEKVARAALNGEPTDG